MRDGEGGVGTELKFLLKLLRRLLGRSLLCGGKAAVHLFEEREVVVERFEVELGVGRDVALIVDGVSHRTAIGQFRPTCPVVGGGVFGICADPVEIRDFVDGEIPGEVGRLLIGQGASEVADGAHHGVLPVGIFRGEEVFVDNDVGLLNLSVGGR